MEGPDLVPQIEVSGIQQDDHIAMGLPGASPEEGRTSSTTQEATPQSLQAVRQQYSVQGLSTDVVNFLVFAWRPGTVKQYDCQLKQWLCHCRSVKVDPFTPTINDILQYLLLRFNAGCSVSTLGTIHSALSKMISFPV